MIKSISLRDIPGRKCTNRNLIADISEFIRSDADAVEVVWDNEYSDQNSARTAYKKCAETMKVGVTVITRGKRVFLLRDIERSE